MRKTFLPILVVFLAAPLLLPKPVQGHGSGPPFLLINGKYAQTNLAYLGDSIFEPGIPWDNAPDKYLAGSNINFEIDTTKLQVPQDVIDGSIFRWEWGDETTEPSYGLKFTHTYNKVGSYLITIEAKSPGAADFVLLDSVQIDIVGDLNYQIPQAKIAVLQGEFKINVPVIFVSQSEVDGSSKIDQQRWFLGNGKYEDGQVGERVFTESDFGSNFVLLQIKDTNGIISYASVRVDRNGENLAFFDINTVNGEVPIASSVEKTENLSNSPLVYIAGVGIVGLVAVGFWIRRFYK